jgi:hypothetical protein
MTKVRGHHASKRSVSGIHLGERPPPEPPPIEPPGKPPVDDPPPEVPPVKDPPPTPPPVEDPLVKEEETYGRSGPALALGGYG